MSGDLETSSKPEENSDSTAASLTSLVLLIILFFVLVKTNPGVGEYATWMTQEIQNSSNSALVDIGAGLLGPFLIESSTTVRDFMLFSVFTTDLGGERTVTVGVLGMFV